MSASTFHRAAMLAVCLAAILGAQSIAAQAAPNEQIRFQGRLTTPAGTPINTATDVRFRLYTAPTGGTHVWEELRTNLVPSADGIITLQLGALNDFAGVNFGQPLYIGVTVESDPEMTPRYLLSSSATTHHARNAAALGGQPASAYARLTGATFTGAVTAPSFIGNLTGTASGFSGSLSGDVTGTQGATVVTSVGGQTAASIAASVTLTGAATASSTPDTLVRRDTSGNFAANNITANTFIGDLSGNATSATTAGSFSGTLSGDVTGTQSATVVSSVGGETAASIAAGVNLALDATDANVGGEIVRRDPSGNFAAGEITADFIGDLTGTADTALNALELLGGTWAAPGDIGTTTPGTGSFTALDATGLSIDGLSSFTSTVNTPGPSYAANEFIATIINAGSNNSRALQASSVATGMPGTGTVSGAILNAVNPGSFTQGAQGVATYTGDAIDPIQTFAMGLYGDARVTDDAAAISAVGMYGRAQDDHLGTNIGLFGVGRGSSGRNIGGFLVANADDTAQAMFSMALPGDMSASAVFFNSATGTNDYGLFVSAANNRIDGDLEITGDLIANIAAAQVSGLGTMAQEDAADYWTAVQTDAEIAAAINGLNLGSMSQEDAGDYYTSAATDAAITAQITALGLGSMSQEDASDYYTSAATDAAITAQINALGLGSMSQEDAADYYTSVATDAAIAAQINALGLGSMSQEDAADYWTAVETDAEISAAISALGLGSMAQEDAADYWTALDTDNAIAAAISGQNLGTIATQDADDVSITGGSVTGLDALGVTGFSTFAAPNTVAPAGSSFSAHAFTASVEDNQAVPARALFSRMDGTDAGSREVTGAWLEAVSDGNITQGVFGQAWYTGPGTFGDVAIGLDGRARTNNDVFAIGTAGRATDAQGGVNIGVHAWGADGNQTAGLFAAANASEATQFGFSSTLPAGFSAAILGLNDDGSADSYGLYVVADNNIIVGDLEITGNLIYTGLTAGDTALFDGQGPAFYLDRANHTGMIDVNDITGLGTMATQDAGDFYTAAATDAQIAAQINALNLDSMSQQDAADYFTAVQTNAAIQSAINLLGSMAHEDAGDYYTASETDAEIAAQVSALGLGTMSTQDADNVSITGGSATLDSFTLNGTGSMNAASATNLNAFDIQLALGHANSLTDVAGNTGQGVNVRASTLNDTSERLIALRGLLTDSHAGTTEEREIRGVSGAVLTDGGSNTGVLGGYFNARARTATTNGVGTLTGVAADATVEAGAGGFTQDQRLVGGRFGSDATNAGLASAFGVIGTAFSDPLNPRMGVNVGSLGWSGGSAGVNIGLFGTVNATEAQVGAAIVGASDAAIYAFNPGPTGYGLYVEADESFIDGNLEIDGDLTVSGTINASITAADTALFDGQGPAFYLDRANHTGTIDATDVTGLGTMAFADTGDYYTIGATDNAISVALNDYTPTASLGTMAFADTGDYYTRNQVDAEIINALAGLGSMAQQDANNVSITGGSATLNSLTVLTGGSVNLPDMSIADMALSALAQDAIASFGTATSSAVADTLVRRDSQGGAEFGTVTADVVDAEMIAANPSNDPLNLSNVPHWIRVEAPEFGTNNVAEDLILLPAGAVVHAVKLKHSDSYNQGSSNNEYTLEVGIPGAPAQLLPAFDVYQQPGDNVFALNNVLASWDHGSPTQITITPRADSNFGGNVGAAEVWLLVSRVE
jgi:hypothetical protein